MSRYIPDWELHPLIAFARRARLAMRISQEEMADRIGSVQSHVSDVERGKTGLSLRSADRYLGGLGFELTIRVKRAPWTPGTLPKEFVDVLAFAAGTEISRDGSEVSQMVDALNEYDRSEGRF